MMHGFIPWDIRITIDLFLGGLGIGIFLISVFLSFYQKEQYSGLIKISAYLAPVLVGTGLLFLISELERPERLLTTMYRFNPHSVTSWGGVIQAIFVLLSLTYAIMLYKKLTANKIFPTVQLLGAVFSIEVGIYHGLLLASLGRPLWAGGMVVILFFVSSLLGGTALLMITKSLIRSFSTAKDVHVQVAAADMESTKEINFSFILFVLTGLQILLILTWQISLYRSGAETMAAFHIMMRDFGTYWWGFVIIAGLLIPFIGSIYQLIKNHQSEMPGGFSIILSLLVIIGSFTLKHIILTAGQISVPFF